MDCKVIVYESSESKNRNAADLIRFEKSLGKLSKIGLSVCRVICSNASALPSGSEASELVVEKGMGILPITEYEDAVIFSGAYPDDQTLADYLDVPDGTLSVDKQKPFNVNDLAPPCACGDKGDRECK